MYVYIYIYTHLHRHAHTHTNSYICNARVHMYDTCMLCNPQTHKRNLVCVCMCGHMYICICIETVTLTGGHFIHCQPGTMGRWASTICSIATGSPVFRVSSLMVSVIYKVSVDEAFCAVNDWNHEPKIEWYHQLFPLAIPSCWLTVPHPFCTSLVTLVPSHLALPATNFATDRGTYKHRRVRWLWLGSSILGNCQRM